MKIINIRDVQRSMFGEGYSGRILEGGKRLYGGSQDRGRTGKQFFIMNKPGVFNKIFFYLFLYICPKCVSLRSGCKSKYRMYFSSNQKTSLFVTSYKKMYYQIKIFGGFLLFLFLF